jgi:hypothetical protein
MVYALIFAERADRLRHAGLPRHSPAPRLEHCVTWCLISVLDHYATVDQ